MSLAKSPPKEGLPWLAVTCGDCQFDKTVMASYASCLLDLPSLGPSVKIEVISLHGQSLHFSVSESLTGRELRTMICEKVPHKPGAGLFVQHGSLPLCLDKTLVQQGILGDSVILSYVHLPVDIYATWSFVKRMQYTEKEFSLEGITKLVGIDSVNQLVDLPVSLRSLTFSHIFNEALDDVKCFPNGLLSLTLGCDFNQSFDVTLPSNLQELTFGARFNQPLDQVIWPSGLKRLTFGSQFDQSLDEVNFPALQSLAFGDRFNQNLNEVNLPGSLQALAFGHDFNQSLEQVNLPAGLKSLTFPGRFNQSFNRVDLQAGLPGLQSLTLGREFNQSLDVKLPDSLQSLTFGDSFNQRLDQVALPKNLQSLTFGACFSQSLDQITLPCSLESCTFGKRLEESLHQVTLPSTLKSLTFSACFNQTLDTVNLPTGLQSLTFGDRFNQSLDEVDFPAGLESLTFGDRFNQSLDEVRLPSGLKSLTFGYQFNRKLDNVLLPTGLRSLTFGAYFDQSLENVNFPNCLENLILGDRFNQSFQRVKLPEGLQSLTFGFQFHQSLDDVHFPSGLQSLTFGDSFNQSLEHVKFPSSLQSLTLGTLFEEALLQGADLPPHLQEFDCRGLLVSCKSYKASSASLHWQRRRQQKQLRKFFEQHSSLALDSRNSEKIIDHLSTFAAILRAMWSGGFRQMVWKMSCSLDQCLFQESHVPHLAYDADVTWCDMMWLLDFRTIPEWFPEQHRPHAKHWTRRGSTWIACPWIRRCEPSRLHIASHCFTTKTSEMPSKMVENQVEKNMRKNMRKTWETPMHSLNDTVDRVLGLMHVKQIRIKVSFRSECIHKTSPISSPKSLNVFSIRLCSKSLHVFLCFCHELTRFLTAQLVVQALCLENALKRILHLGCTPRHIAMCSLYSESQQPHSTAHHRYPRAALTSKAKIWL